MMPPFIDEGTTFLNSFLDNQVTNDIFVLGKFEGRSVHPDSFCFWIKHPNSFEEDKYHYLMWMVHGSWFDSCKYKTANIEGPTH